MELTLNPANLIDSSRFEVKTADATISLDPEHSYLVETRIIDGRKYLLIPAERILKSMVWGSCQRRVNEDRLRRNNDGI